jgi:hypothetical protein
MKVPSADLEKWRARLREAAPSAVLREMASAYGANKSALGFMVSDLYRDVDALAVQLVWKWDIDRTGRGLTDKELDEVLSQQKL